MVRTHYLVIVVLFILAGCSTTRPLPECPVGFIPFSFSDLEAGCGGNGTANVITQAGSASFECNSKGPATQLCVPPDTCSGGVRVNSSGDFECNPDSCPSRTVPISARTIRLDGADASVDKGDPEINSNDCTVVKVRYKITQHERSVWLKTEMVAIEGHSNCTPENTVILTSREEKLYEVDPTCPNLRIAKITGLVMKPRSKYDVEKRHEYKGQKWGRYHFPSTGSLKNIKVRFDRNGSKDNEVQSLSAELPNFTVDLTDK